MKALTYVFALLAGLASAFAAEVGRAPRLQTGKMSSVQLLATARITQGAPDGVRFLFLVRRAANVSGNPTLKETRDFLVGGSSYQEQSERELGKRIEPATVFDAAEGFFAKQPGARRLAPEDLKDAYVLTLYLGGGKLTAGSMGDITLHVGFGKETEPFTFSFPVPPEAGKSAARPAVAAGLPPSPLEGRTRYVAKEGVGFAPWTFDLKIADTGVSGAIFQNRSDTAGVATNQVGPFEIFDGKVEGSMVSFKTKSANGDRVVSFKGERAGDEIRFQRTIALSAGAVPGLNGILGAGGAETFVAKRATE